MEHSTGYIKLWWLYYRQETSHTLLSSVGNDSKAVIRACKNMMIFCLDLGVNSSNCDRYQKAITCTICRREEKTIYFCLCWSVSLTFGFITQSAHRVRRGNNSVEKLHCLVIKESLQSLRFILSLRPKINFTLSTVKKVCLIGLKMKF